MTDRIISLEGVEKSYGDFTLGPVNLEIEPGYVIAVIGPNGSGKSTLFRMLMNLSHPDSGSISLFGGGYPENEVKIKQRIGYVPETSVGHDEMDAKSLGQFVSHWYPRWDRRLYKDLLGRSDMEPRKKFRNLSKGMQRRLSFALAAATRADLLLLDEPTDGVDPFARREMLDRRGERAALYAAMGTGMGTGVGAAFAVSFGPLAIAVCAILGALIGMGVGYFYRGEDED